MKYVLFIALLLPNLLWAQKNVEKKNAIQIIKGIGIGGQMLEGSPTGCMRTVESSEIGFNYRFGIDYQRQIVGGLYIKAGARFSLWSLNNATSNYLYNPYMICYEPYYLDNGKLRTYYIETPIALQYKFGKNKLQFYVEIGANPMFNIEGSQLTKEQTFSFALQAGAGLSYELSNTCSLFSQISSRFRTEELTLYANYGYLYEVGLEFGVAFYF